MSVELVMSSNHLILCHPILLLPSIFPSIRVFSNDLVLRIRWPRYWSFSISPSNEYSVLVSFRINWFDLLAVQWTLESLLLLQHHSSKASILWCSAFFMVQLSHPYMTTGKTIALTTWIFVSKVMSLLSIMLSRFVHSFPFKEQASLNFMAAVTVRNDFKAQESKICHCFHCWGKSVCDEVMGLDALILVFKCWVLSQLFHFPVSSSSRGSLVLLHFLPLGCCHLFSLCFIQFGIFHDVLCI